MAYFPGSRVLPQTFSAEHGPFQVSESTLTVQAGPLSFEKLQALLDDLRAEYPQLFAKQTSWEKAKAACQQLSALWRKRLLAGHNHGVLVSVRSLAKAHTRTKTWLSWCKDHQIEVIKRDNGVYCIREADRALFLLIVKLKDQRAGTEVIKQAVDTYRTKQAVAPCA